MSNDVPKAQVAPGGKVGGDVPRGRGPTEHGVMPHKRKVSNFLLDRSMQLRYVLSVVLVSTLITGSLGYLIYRQEQKASAGVAAGLARTFDDVELQKAIGGEMAKGDSKLLLTMVLVGLGLAVVLAAFLIVMTHKVAGPLHKVSLIFDEMATGKLVKTAGPRRWDMLQDFHASFREMHDATRARVASDVAVMEQSLAALTAAGAPGDDPAVASMQRLIARRRESLGA